MNFLKGLGGVAVLIWVLGILFKVGGNLIHILVVVAVIVFMVDMITGKQKNS